MVRQLVATSIAAAALAGFAISTASPAIADGPYKNCSEAHADGRYNIPKGDPDYRSQLDRDGDGFACEPKP